MPLTAGAVKESGASVPEDMTDEQIKLAIWALRTDLPGAVEFVEEAAKGDRGQAGWAYLSRKPGEMSSRQEWDILVSRLARLFASPYRLILERYMKDSFGVKPAFVNCCIIVAFDDTLPEDKRQKTLFALQTAQQVTPDC